MPDPSRLDAGITEIADAFDRWLADYQAAPDQFGEPEDHGPGYGEHCAATLVRLIEEAREELATG